MAVIETWFEQDLQKPVKVRYIDGNLFSHNGNGNRIGVVVTNNGEAVTLTGTVSGYAVLADGTTVPCTGTRSGNKASILVPAAAYSPGSILISIFLTDGTTVTTLAALSSSVIMARTGNQIDPGTVVTDWTNTINAAMQSVETAAANLGNIVATPYANLTFPVPLGKYTIYNNGLYRCISPIASSEAWTAAHWTNVKLGDEVTELKRTLPHEYVSQIYTKNLYDPSRNENKTIDSVAVGETQTVTDSTTLVAQKIWIPVGQNVTFTGVRSYSLVNANNVVTYQKTFLETTASVTLEWSSLPAGTEYIWLCTYKENATTNTQLELGNSSTTYAPYVFGLQINGKDLPFAYQSDIVPLEQDISGIGSRVASAESEIDTLNEKTGKHSSGLVDSASGNPVSVVTDDMETPIKSVVESGGTSQNAVPTPSNPQVFVGSAGYDKCVIFDGDENWSDGVLNYVQTAYRFVISDSSAPVPNIDTTSPAALSNYKEFLGTNSDALLNANDGFAIRAGGGIQILMPISTGITTAAQLAEYLESHPLVVWYRSTSYNQSSELFYAVKIESSSIHRAVGTTQKIKPLMGGSKYADTLDFITGVVTRNTQVFTRDGTATVNLATARGVFIILANTSSFRENHMDAWSDQYSYAGNVDTSALADNCFTLRDNANVYIRDDSVTWTAADYKTKLGNSPVSFVIPKRTATTENVSVASDVLGIYGSLTLSGSGVLTVYYAKNIADALSELKTEISEEITQTDFLSGKKYVAAGDSYTAWSDAEYISGDYAGQPVTYDREIRLAHIMTGSNAGISGSTMALCKDSVADKASRDQNAFSNTRYLNIPSDTDILTISFGINDITYSNVGQLGDTTNDTFYGAWDVVLKYYRQNRPNMKIGILLFQRGDNDFYRAVLEIAKYYGIPVLDFYGGEDTPIYVDGKAYPVSSEISELRKEYYGGHAHASADTETFQGKTVRYIVDASAHAGHPGFRAHIDEANIIAEFLKRL